MNPTRKKMLAAGVSVLSNLGLVVLKLIVGLVTGSVSVISEAIHSAIDLFAAMIAFLAVRTSGRPADRDHPFGHGKVENLAGGVEAALIFLAAAWIIWEAVGKLRHPSPLESTSLAIWVMFVSALANIVVSRMLFRVGKETDSVALEADGWHLLTDVYTSAGVMAALAAIWIGAKAAPQVNLNWLDPVAAIAVALLIVHTAIKLTLKTAHDLMDGSLPRKDERWIRDHIKTVPGVKGYHRLKTRKAGAARFVEFHVFVEPSMSVEESHRITKEIEEAIQARFPDTTVTIHVEPRGEE